jgi:hypothetical protein
VKRLTPISLTTSNEVTDCVAEIQEIERCKLGEDNHLSQEDFILVINFLKNEQMKTAVMKNIPENALNWLRVTLFNGATKPRNIQEWLEIFSDVLRSLIELQVRFEQRIGFSGGKRGRDNSNPDRGGGQSFERKKANHHTPNPVVEKPTPPTGGSRGKVTSQSSTPRCKQCNEKLAISKCDVSCKHAGHPDLNTNKSLTFPESKKGKAMKALQPPVYWIDSGVKLSPDQSRMIPV